MKKILCLFIFVFGLAGTLSAKVTLPALLGDNMVLQQQSDVKIWGWCQPNTAVKITASWGVKGTVKSDSEGNWIFTVATPSASYTSHTITISDGEPVVLKNILIGEVWLCSGQSNMEMTFTGYWGSPVLGAQ
ncbi:sialate O-acetylesterase, partial [bacterium]|nr:sialate O-acetylesterase [bacterium]